MHEVSSLDAIDHDGQYAKNNAAIAWFAAAFCVSTAGVKWFSPGGDIGDAMFALVLGGAAAFLALALRRRLLHVLRTCRRVALFSGMLNGLLLHSVLTTFIVGLLVSPVGSLSELPRHQFDTLIVATLSTFVPWAAYWVLREERVRAWCATHTSVA